MFNVISIACILCQQNYVYPYNYMVPATEQFLQEVGERSHSIDWGIRIPVNVE